MLLKLLSISNIAKAIAYLAFVVVCFSSGMRAPAIGSTTKAAGCGAYDPNPKCTEKARRDLHKSFGLLSIEQMHQKRLNAGLDSELIIGIIQIKRRPGLALVFHRDRKGQPLVEVYRQHTKEQPSRYPSLRTHITEESWQAVVAKGSALNDIFAREEVYTCGATFNIEIIDETGTLRTPVGDSCGHEPRGIYFDALAQSAIEQLPQCAALNTEWQNDATQRLLACFQSRGSKKVGR
jgi:hypothetical protein